MRDMADCHTVDEMKDAVLTQARN
ncbi:hypothetical protein THIOSC15_3450013 [uncultured Thiomicrorhabdus sp.]